MKGKTKNLLIKILIGFVILTILGVFIFLILGKGKKENKENDMMIFRDSLTDDPTSADILCPAYTACIPKDRCDEGTKKFNCATQKCDCKDGFVESGCDGDDTNKCYLNCQENEIADCDNDNKRVCKCITGFDKCGDKCVQKVDCAVGATSTCINGQFVCVCPDNQQHVVCGDKKSCVAKCSDDERNVYSCAKECCVCKPEFSDYNYNAGECQPSTKKCQANMTVVPQVMSTFAEDYCSNQYYGNCNNERFPSNVMKLKFGSSYLTVGDNNKVVISQNAPLEKQLWVIDNQYLVNYSLGYKIYLLQSGDTKPRETVFQPTLSATPTENRGKMGFVRIKDNINQIMFVDGLYLTVDTASGNTVFTTSNKDYFPNSTNNQWIVEPVNICQE